MGSTEGFHSQDGYVWDKERLPQCFLGSMGNSCQGKKLETIFRTTIHCPRLEQFYKYPATALTTVSIYFSLRFTLTEEAEGTKDDFCATGVVESGGPGELSAAGLKFMDPNEKEVAVAVAVPAEGAGVMDALGEAAEKENVAAPVRLGARACVEASVAKG